MTIANPRYSGKDTLSTHHKPLQATSQPLTYQPSPSLRTFLQAAANAYAAGTTAGVAAGVDRARALIVTEVCIPDHKLIFNLSCVPPPLQAAAGALNTGVNVAGTAAGVAAGAARAGVNIAGTAAQTAVNTASYAAGTAANLAGSAAQTAADTASYAAGTAANLAGTAAHKAADTASYAAGTAANAAQGEHGSQLS